MAQPSIASAQAVPGPGGPGTNLAGSTLPTAGEALARGQDPYPRADVAQNLLRGGQNVTFKPLKTVLTARGPQALADRLLLTFKQAVTDVELADVSAKAAKLGAGAAHALARTGARSFLVDVSGATSLETAARAFVDADVRVQGAGPDYVVHTSETPNDPDFGQQWGPTKIQAPAAWNRTHGSSGKIIAILDTGLNDLGANAHPEFAGKVSDHRDFTGSSVGTDDVVGHGTHVAGIAAALTNNNQGIAGISFSSNLIVGKVLNDNGDGSVSMLFDGIYWAADHNATVINMSLGGDEDCNPSWWEDLFDTGRNELRDAINYAWNRNIVLVASAGNNGNSDQIWPAACPNVLSVANTNQSDQRSSTSNFGTWVDVAAPGSGIWSTTVPGGSRCQSGIVGAFANCSGTSMAAPHVSGLAALVQASCPVTTSSAVVSRITGTADAIAGTGSLWQFGRINALNAVCFRAPANLHLGTLGATSMQLLWTDTTPGESSFQVARSVTGANAWFFFNVPANTTSWTDTGLTSGVSYDHIVRACDVAGCSGWSNTVTATAGFLKLTVSTSAGGKVTAPGINCGLGGADCTELYAPGTVVTLRATPLFNPLKNIEFELDHWEGACVTDLYQCTLTMNSSKTTRAVFVQVAP
jgi:thermitase